MLRPQMRRLYRRLFAPSIPSAYLVVVSLFYPSVTVSNRGLPRRRSALPLALLFDTSESGSLS